MTSLLSVVTVGLLLLAPASANRPSKNCIQLQVPVKVSATNSRYDTLRVDSNIEAVDWVWDTNTWSHPNVTARVTGEIAVHETFSISAQLCFPVKGKGSRSDILQIASHGVAFDKSYVDAAIAKGYSILTYDRIGTGASTKPDAYTIVQAPVEIEILKELTKLARSGKLLEVSKIKSEQNHKDKHTYKPGKVVHVGHSFGSALTIGMLSSYGELSDGAILTGFVLGSQLGSTKTSAFGLEFAPASDARRFGDRPSGYLVQGTESSVQQIFLKKGAFEPSILPYAESIKQTATVGELLSGGAPLGRPAPAFRGPVQFFIGEYDFALCGGDCNNAYDLEDLKLLYPAATDVSVYLQPGTGHGLTLSTNATAGYDVMFSYLEEHSL